MSIKERVSMRIHKNEDYLACMNILEIEEKVIQNSAITQTASHDSQNSILIIALVQ